MISIIATEGAKPKKIHHPDDLYDFEHNRNAVNNIIESLEWELHRYDITSDTHCTIYTLSTSSMFRTINFYYAESYVV